MKISRILIVLGLATAYYIIWQLGFDYVWANIVKAGISTITAAFSDIQEVAVVISDDAIRFHFRYPDRKSSVNIEYLLPVVLLLAWQTYLFIIKTVPRKFALKSLGFNLGILWLMQIFFPLLLFNVSMSKVKASFFFLGLQVFGMIVLFMIIKDSVLLKYKKSDVQSVNAKKEN